MRRGLGGALAAITLCAGAADAAQTGAGCRPGVVELRGDWGQARFRVEIADDESERMTGLMNREDLPRGAGMLFVYPGPRPASFWMRNTLIPLDIIFADASGTVQNVHSNATPRDETPIPGGDAIQYVLEINGGMAAPMGIEPGTQLRHPTISDDIAAWPCAAPGD